MKTTTKLLLSAFALAQFSLFAQTPPLAPPIYEYDWTGGQPGFSGKIFLDAPSSGVAPHGGRDSDVLPGSYVMSPFGTFSILNTGLDAAFGFGGVVIWDANHILGMDLFFNSPRPINNPFYNLPAIGHARADTFDSQNIIEIGSLAGGFASVFSMDDFTGQWLAAPVPEPSAAAILMIAGAVAGLGRRRLTTSKAK